MSPTRPSLVCGPADDRAADFDDTPEYPLSAPIKPDDPERHSDQSKAETDGCAPERSREADEGASSI
jgi:hypothetical protein